MKQSTNLLKKFLPCVILLVAVLICFLALPTEANAAGVEALTYSIEDGKVTITGYNREITGEIVIPSTIEGYPVVAIGSTAFRDCDLESVVIPEGVTSIGEIAFGALVGFSSVDKIYLPSTLTKIEANAFYCTGVKEVHIASIASWANINLEGQWESPFSGQGDLYVNGTKITELVIPDGVQKVSSHAFSYCGSITSVKFSNSVTTIGEGAFAYCDNLKKVELNNVSKIEQSAFTMCHLEQVVLPNHYVDFDYNQVSPGAFVVGEDNAHYSLDEYGTLYNKDKTTLLRTGGSNCVIPVSVSMIREGALSRTYHVLYMGTEKQWGRITGATISTDSVTFNYSGGTGYHTWEPRRTIKEATCKEEGEIEYGCKVCGKDKTEIVSKLVTHTWSEGIPLSETSNAFLCITCGKVKVEGVVSVENEKDHFHKDAVVEVIVIDETHSEAHGVVSHALKDHHKYVAYDISAILKDKYVQPDGTIEVKIAIPEDFDMDTIAIAYITKDGKIEHIPCTVDKENHTASFKTDHFSYYAMTTENTVTPPPTTALSEPTLGSTEPPKTTGSNLGSSEMLILIFAMGAIFGGGIAVAAIIFSRKRK